MPSPVEPPATAPLMKAVVREVYGSPDVLSYRDVERPVVREGRLLLRVKAAGIDRAAWHLMVGKPYLMRLVFGLRRPRKPGLGLEVAGVVEAVGAGVTGFAVGDAVFGEAEAAFGEYALADPGRLAPMPAGATFEQAAAVSVSAVTALEALRDQGHLTAGQRVLVIGASGGVGTFAVQIAKAWGAQVTAVCSAAKADLVRGLGAEHVIDYATDDLGEGRYDLVLDIAGNRPLATLRRRLTPDGTLVFVGGEHGGPLSGGMGRQVRSAVLSPFVRQHLGGVWVSIVRTAHLDVLRAMVEEGTLTPAIDRVCTFAQIPQAMRDLESGRVRGKIVAVP